MLKYLWFFWTRKYKCLSHMLEFANIRCCNPVEFVNINYFLFLYSEYLWPLQKQYFCDCETTDGITSKSLIGLKYQAIQSPLGWRGCGVGAWGGRGVLTWYIDDVDSARWSLGGPRADNGEIRRLRGKLHQRLP